MPFGLQPIHIAVIVLVALLIFGPKQLPAIGRWVARTFNDLRKGTRDMADGFKEESAKMDKVEGSAPSSPISPAPPEARFCTSCGASNPADARFCAKCGTKLVSLPPEEKNGA
jgi:sec-independent protein translocase protein TatA